MKLYRVKVNGKLYEVELEAVSETSGTISPKEVTSSQATNNGDGEPFLAPIGGKVLDVKVTVGSSIKKGDVLCVIEAMKLENEVTALVDGTIKQVIVNKGDTVANKDPLFIIG